MTTDDRVAGVALGRSALTDDFLDATKQGVFQIKRCTACGVAAEPQAMTCGSCWSPELRVEPASGNATIVSWAVVHTPGSPSTGEPTIVVIAALAEGPWWWSAMVGTRPDDVHVGMPITMKFVMSANGESIPLFGAK